MKTKPFTGTLLATAALCLSLAGCKYGEKEPSGEQPEAEVETMSIDSLESLDRVPLVSAQHDINHYVHVWDSVSKASGSSASVPIRSYLINAPDLIGVLGIQGQAKIKTTFQKARVYLGLNNKSEFKLYMTPVGYNDIDSILYNPTTKEYYVYDLNAPCPSTCDMSSPLYTLDPVTRIK